MHTVINMYVLFRQGMMSVQHECTTAEPSCRLETSLSQPGWT